MFLIRFCPKIEHKAVLLKEMSRFLRFRIQVRIEIKKEALIP